MGKLDFSAIAGIKGKFGRKLAGRIQARLNRLHQPDRISLDNALTLINNLYINGVPIPLDIFDKAVLPEDEGKRSSAETILTQMKQGVQNGTLAGAERKQIGLYSVQYNPLRVLGRSLAASVAKTGASPEQLREIASRKTLTGCSQEDIGFNFVAKFDPDIHGFGKLEKNGVTFGLFEVPGAFAPYHFLLFPLRKDYPAGQVKNPFLQILDIDNPGILHSLWAFIQIKGNRDLRIGFNAWGAYASFAMQHFQGFYVTEKWKPSVDEMLFRLLATKDPQDIEAHPLKFARWFPKSYRTVDNLMGALSLLHELDKERHDVSYNLYMTPRGIALFPRLRQGVTLDVFEGARFSTGYAFLEMTLEIICPDRESFIKVKEGDILDAFKQISLDKNPFARNSL